MSTLPVVTSTVACSSSENHDWVTDVTAVRQSAATTAAATIIFVSAFIVIPYEIDTY